MKSKDTLKWFPEQAVFERIKSGVSISAIAREFKTSRQTILRAKAKLQTPDI